MARKTKEEAEKTFHALLAAAAVLFTKQGVGATTLNEVAQEAGLTRGAVYWHFKGKDDIIRALWETYSVSKLEPLEMRLLALDGPKAKEDFEQIMIDLLNLVRHDPQVGQAMQIVLHNVEFTENKSDLQEFLNAEKNQLESALVHAFSAISHAHQFRAGLNAETCALGFLSFLHGMLTNHFSPYDRMDLSLFGKSFIEIYMNGILATVR